MKGLKKWLLGGVITAFLPVITLNAQVVESNRLTLVPTREVEPLQVLVNSTGEDNFFSGEVLSRRPLVADTLQFTLLNEFDGVVWREYLKLPHQAQRIMPFYFEAIDVTGPLFLSVQAYDKFGNTAGSGQENIDFPEKISSVTINSSEVFLNDNNEINIDLFVVNGPVKQTYIPQIKIYQGLEHFGNLIATEEPPFVDLQPRQQQELSFTLPFEYAPGVYEIVTILLDASTRVPLSSAHYQQIYRSGYFFKVVDLESFYTSADKSTARLKLDGLSTVVLTEPVQMRVRLEDQQNIYLDKNYSFTLQPGYFTKYIDLNLPSYVEALNGSATFFLQGAKIQTVNFTSEETTVNKESFESKIDTTEVDLATIPPLVLPSKRWYLSDTEVLAVVIGCTILLLLLVLFNWVKSRWLLLGLTILIGFGSAIEPIKALTVGRDVFPMVEWSSPITNTSMVYNPSNSEGFAWLPVKGRIFNYLTQAALIKREAFNEVRLNFISPQGKKYQFLLQPEILKSGSHLSLDSASGNYFFILDLGLLSEAEPLGVSEPLIWEDGKWQFQMIFPYQQKEEEMVYLGTPLKTFGFFEVDQRPPLWQWQLKEASGALLGEADFTNQPITVSITCQDQDSACITPFQEFSTVGNFCDDALKCNAQAARAFEVCDIAGNCSTESLSISGYDPVPPEIESLLIDNLEATVATETPVINLRYLDPSRVEGKDLPVEFNTQLCGNENPFFWLDNKDWMCTERLKPCVLVSDHNVWRGDSYNGVCRPTCPEGYQYQNGMCQIICGEGGFKADRMCLPFNLQRHET